MTRQPFGGIDPRPAPQPWRRRSGGSRRAALAAAVVLTVVAGSGEPVRAAEVRVQDATVYIEAGGSERNDLTVRRDPADHTVDVTDAASTLDATGPGCVWLPGNVVRCWPEKPATVEPPACDLETCVPPPECRWVGFLEPWCDVYLPRQWPRVEFRSLGGLVAELGAGADRIEVGSDPEPAGPADLGHHYGWWFASIDGGPDDDVLTAHGSSWISGGPGNDRLASPRGRLDGGPGTDVFSGGGVVDYSAANTGVSVSIDGRANDGEPGEEENVPSSFGVFGSTHPDSFEGGPGDDSYTDWSGDTGGNDRILGGPGRDWLAGGAGDDALDGGEGDDRIFSDRGNDRAIGGAGDDELEAGTGRDTVQAGDGADLVRATDGADLIHAGAGGDAVEFYGELWVVAGNKVYGEGGDDRIEGTQGADVLDGGDGHDRISSSVGKDQERGGAGDDVFFGTFDDAADVLDGGSGADTVDYRHVEYWSAGAAVSLDGVANDGGIWKGQVLSAEGDNVQATVEHVIGTWYDDRLTGSAGANRLDGGPGKDVLTGAAGTDTLLGGDDDDVFMEGGSATGADRLDGGWGTDTADYSRRSSALAIDLDDVADDGASQERDNVTSSVEVLLGGSAADRLTATGPFAATVRSGHGNDSISIDDGDADSAECGSGSDTVLADAVDILDAACETVRR